MSQRKKKESETALWFSFLGFFFTLRDLNTTKATTAWKTFSELTGTHPRSILGWAGFHHYKWWPQGSHICQFCSDNRRRHVLHGGLCLVSSLQSRSSCCYRKYGLFWCQLCRELGEQTEQLKHFHWTLQIQSVAYKESATCWDTNLFLVRVRERTLINTNNLNLSEMFWNSLRWG